MIIGITGVKGVGKNEYANALTKGFAQLDPTRPVVEYSFATPFKALLQRVLNCSPEMIEALKNGTGSLTVRDKDLVPSSTHFDGRTFVREIGMAIRTANSDYLLDEAWKFIGDHIHYHIIITDVRFEDEAQFVREICRGDVVCIVSNKSKSDGHITEKGIPSALINHTVDASSRDLAVLANDALQFIKSSI
jgi:hypothetical protein